MHSATLHRSPPQIAALSQIPTEGKREEALERLIPLNSGLSPACVILRESRRSSAASRSPVARRVVACVSRASRRVASVPIRAAALSKIFEAIPSKHTETRGFEVM